MIEEIQNSIYLKEMKNRLWIAVKDASKFTGILIISNILMLYIQLIYSDLLSYIIMLILSAATLVMFIYILDLYGMYQRTLKALNKLESKE